MTIRLSPAERTLVERAADIYHQSFSEFCRDQILNTADDLLDASPSPG